MLPLDYCRSKIKNHQQTGIIRFPGLTAAQRKAFIALHALMAEITAITEDYSDLNVALTTLQWWQQQINDVYQVNHLPAHPALQLLQPAIQQFNLPQTELLTVLEAKKQTLIQPRFTQMSDLQTYAQQSGYITGRLTSRILGFQVPETLAYADLAGQVLGISYLVARIGADARQGRLYLPIKKLEETQVPASVIFNHQGGREFNQLVEELIAELTQQYRKTVALLPAQDKSRQKPSLAQLACSYALLQEIRRDGVANLLRYQLDIPKPRQYRIALKTFLCGFHP